MAEHFSTPNALLQLPRMCHILQKHKSLMWIPSSLHPKMCKATPVWKRKQLTSKRLCYFPVHVQTSCSNINDIWLLLCLLERGHVCLGPILDKTYQMTSWEKSFDGLMFPGQWCITYAHALLVWAMQHRTYSTWLPSDVILATPLLQIMIVGKRPENSLGRSKIIAGSNIEYLNFNWD